jgi:hypothetical protein
LETNFNPKNKFWVLLQLSAFSLSLSSLGVLISEPILKMVGYDNNQHLLAKSFINDPGIVVFAGAVILAPIFEELGFRAWLRPSIKNMIVGFWFSFGSLILTFFLPELTLLSFFITFSVCLYWVLTVQKNNLNSIIPQKFYKYFYYLQSYYLDLYILKIITITQFGTWHQF